MPPPPVKIGRSLSATVVAAFGERLVGLVGVVLLARLLEPSDIGKFVYVSAVVAIACSLLNVGASWSLMARPTVTASAISAHMFLQVLPVLVVGTSAVMFAPLVGHIGLTDIRLAVVVCGAQLITGFGATSRLLLEREFRFEGIAVATLLSAMLSLGVGLLLALHGFGVWAMAIGAGPPSLVGAAVQTVAYLGLRPVWRELRCWEAAELRRYLAAGRTLWLGSQAVSLATQLDNVLVGALLGPATLGVYDRAFRFAQSAVAILSQSAGRVALSVYARSGRTDPERARIAHRSVAVALMRLCLPAVAILMVSSGDISVLLLGPRWAAVGPILALMGPYFLFRVLDENLLAYLLGTVQNRARAMGWVVVALVSVPVIPFGILIFGARGAAVAIAVAMAAGWLWQQATSDPVGLRRIVAAGVRPLVATVPAALVAAGVASIELGLLPRLAIELVATTGVYALVLAIIDRRALIELLELRRDLSRATTASEGIQ